MMKHLDENGGKKEDWMMHMCDTVSYDTATHNTVEPLF